MTRRWLEIITAFLSILLLSLRRSALARAMESAPHLVIGVTHSQTCLLLRKRLRTLREAGFRVTLICSPGPLADQLAQREGIDFIPISMRRGIAPLHDLIALLRLTLLLFRLHPDVTEFSTPKAGLLGSIAAWIAAVPARVYMLRGLRLEASRGGEERLLLRLEKLAAAASHTVLCNSESLRAQALALGIAPAWKLEVLGRGSSNGVDTERFSPGPASLRAELGLPASAPVVGFVGRLTYAKGVPDLLCAFDLLLQSEPQAHLLLVGWFDAAEDALSHAWRQRILKHPRIHVTGMVEDAAPYYRAMDLLVLPTWREGFPNAALEAASTALPIITTQATGACDSVEDGVTGILLPPGYPAALCDSILELLHDPRRRQQMGVAARQRILQHYSEATVFANTVAFYHSLTAEAVTGRPIVPLPNS
jgi:glycosyltransferase involved in cell wall biosynthesis